MKPISIPKKISEDQIMFNSYDITTFAIFEGLTRDSDFAKLYRIVDRHVKSSSYFYIYKDDLDWEENNTLVKRDRLFTTLDYSRYDINGQLGQERWSGIIPTIEGEAFDLVKDEFVRLYNLPFYNNEIYVAEFGEYIEDAVPYKLGEKLAKAREKGLLKETGKVFNSSIGPLKVLEYKNKKYVRYDTKHLLNVGAVITPYQVSWDEGGIYLEVKPLRFIVDEDEKIATCQRVVQAGKDALYDVHSTDFEDSPLSLYLNGPFLKDILLPGSKLARFIITDEPGKIHDKISDIKELVDEIIETTKYNSPINHLVKTLIEKLIREYNGNIESLKGNLDIESTLHLTLEPQVSKEEIKARLLENLENILAVLKGFKEDFEDYYKFLETLNGLFLEKTVDEEEGSLRIDVGIASKALEILEPQEKEVMTDDLKKLIADFRDAVMKEMTDCIFTSNKTLVYEKPQQIKTYDELEIEFRRSWHSFLIKLNERVASSELLNNIQISMRNIIAGLYSNANETMASMYLNEINKVTTKIRGLIKKLPKDNRQGNTEELLDILNSTPDGTNQERPLEILRAKLRLLHSLKMRIEEYVYGIKEIDSYKYTLQSKSESNS